MSVQSLNRKSGLFVTKVLFPFVFALVVVCGHSLSLSPSLSSPSMSPSLLSPLGLPLLLARSFLNKDAPFGCWLLVSINEGLGRWSLLEASSDCRSFFLLLCLIVCVCERVCVNVCVRVPLGLGWRPCSCLHFHISLSPTSPSSSPSPSSCPCLQHGEKKKRRHTNSRFGTLSSLQRESFFFPSRVFSGILRKGTTMGLLFPSRGFFPYFSHPVFAASCRAGFWMLKLARTTHKHG